MKIIQSYYYEIVSVGFYEQYFKSLPHCIKNYNKSLYEGTTISKWGPKIIILCTILINIPNDKKLHKSCPMYRYLILLFRNGRTLTTLHKKLFTLIKS